jgi:putative LysE/RhtB family amino acid efflux pump
MLSSVVKGVWLGFCIAAPVGPIGILVLTQALRRGPGAALASGLGAALADLIYGLLAVAGVRLAAGHARIVGVTGGFILLWLAWRSWRASPANGDAPEMKIRLGGTATTFFLTLSNPMTILSFAAMVASTGGASPGYFVMGVFLGSMLWWTILSVTGGSLGRWIEIRAVVLNRLSAATLASFGIWAIWSRALK